MNPPTARTIDQLIAESNPAYDPMRQNYQGQIATANSRLGESENILGQQQKNAFSDITQASARRGALFSGFTPDQQARYTSDKYLPALANLRATNEQTIQGLNTNIMNLDSDQIKTAQQTREGDLSRVYDYQKTQADRQFQTEQANVAYQREMEKLRQEQSFTASENTKTRNNQTQTQQGNKYASMSGELGKKVGADGFISPTTWAQAKAVWIQSGYPSADFDKSFSAYKNPKNKFYK